LLRISPNDPLQISGLLSNYPSITTEWMLEHYRGPSAVRSFLRDAAFKAPELADGLRLAFESQTPEVLRSETAAMANHVNEIVLIARKQTLSMVHEEVSSLVAAAEARGMKD